MANPFQESFQAAQGQPQQNPMAMLMQLIQAKNAMDAGKLNELKMQHEKATLPLLLQKLQAEAKHSQAKSDFYSDPSPFMEPKYAAPSVEAGGGPAGGPMTLNLQKQLEAAAGRGFIPGEALLNHQAQRELARATLAATEANRKRDDARAEAKLDIDRARAVDEFGYRPTVGAPTPAPSPQNFPRATPEVQAGRNAEAVRILQEERARATNPQDIASLDKEIANMSGAPFGSGAKPTRLTIADAPEGLSNRDKRKWLMDQTKPSIAGGGAFTPQSLEFVAKQYLAGDRQAIQGFARNSTARIALQNAIVDEAAKQGMSPTETAAKIAEFAGTVAGSRTVGQRAANISLAATEAEEMIGIVKETSDKFGRTNFVPFNIALKAFETGTGQPEVAAFGASLNALVNVYARAINPTGVPTVSDKEHARAVINAVQSPAQVDAVLGIIKRELEIAKRAPQTVREGIRGSVVGTPQRRANDTAPAVGAYSDAEKERRYQEWKAKNGG